MSDDEITPNTPVIVNELSGKYHSLGSSCIRRAGNTGIPIKSAYDAPGLDACKRCIPDDIAKHGPDEKPSVLEVKSTIEVTWHLPLDVGDDPHGAITNRLMDTEDLRWIDSISLDQHYKMEKY